MFKQIKELRQESGDTAKELASLKEEMQAVKAMFKTEQEALAEIRGLQIDFINQFKQNLKALGFLQDSVQRELEQFKALNSQITRELMGKLEKELAEVTHHATSVLSSESDKSKKVKEQVEGTAKNLVILNNNIAKLAEIGQALKKTDFEMSEFVKRVREEDKHKLELMQENEKLKSMIAKMKRNRPMAARR